MYLGNPQGSIGWSVCSTGELGPGMNYWKHKPQVAVAATLLQLPDFSSFNQEHYTTDLVRDMPVYNGGLEATQTQIRIPIHYIFLCPRHCSWEIYRRKRRELNRDMVDSVESAYEEKVFTTRSEVGGG